MFHDRRYVDLSHDLDDDLEHELKGTSIGAAPGKVTRTARLAEHVAGGRAGPGGRVLRAAGWGVGAGGLGLPGLAAAGAGSGTGAAGAVQRRESGEDLFAGILPGAADGEPLETVAPLEVAAAGVREPAGRLPHVEVIQAAFGHHDVSGVGAHTGAEASAAARALGAMAYASGENVAFAAAAPDLFTAAHEAAHVVQQRAGVSLAGGVGRAGDAYERHADAVAEAVVAGATAVPLLDSFVGAGGGGSDARAVQRRTDDAAPAAEPDEGGVGGPDLAAGVPHTSHEIVVTVATKGARRAAVSVSERDIERRVRVRGGSLDIAALEAWLHALRGKPQGRPGMKVASANAVVSISRPQEWMLEISVRAQGPRGDSRTQYHFAVTGQGRRVRAQRLIVVDVDARDERHR